jgi:tRNA-dihydrouridine synthase C
MWLSYLKRTWAEAAELHAAIRRLHDPREILEVIERALAVRGLIHDLIPAHQRATLGPFDPLDPPMPYRAAGLDVASAVQ